jgi:cytochrome P450
MCFNESLRMQPPVFYSSSVRMSEEVQAGKLRIRKGDPITIGMGDMQNHSSEWQEPEKFIPERFDHKSKYYLTPSGQKRNTYSFSPFLGGQRICVGKTFIEVVSKLTVPTLLTKFKFDFQDGVDREKAAHMWNNMTMQRVPKFTAKVTKREVSYKASQ